jgi:hypothetical protein
MRKRTIASAVVLCAVVVALHVILVGRRHRVAVEPLGNGYRLECVSLSETATRLRLVTDSSSNPQLVTEALAENRMIVSLLTTPVFWGRTNVEGAMPYFRRVAVGADSSVIDIGIGDSALVEWGDTAYPLVEFERCFRLAINVSPSAVIIVTVDLPAKEKVFVELVRILARLSQVDTSLSFRIDDEPGRGQDGE